jgi:dihydrofolate reductase
MESAWPNRAWGGALCKKSQQARRSLWHENLQLEETQMRKMIAAMKVSLDGKFQGPEGYADWVNGWSEDYDLVPQIDACLLGGQMYRGYEQYWSAMRDDPKAPSLMTGTLPTEDELAWSKRIPDLPHYVFSRTLTEPQWSNTRIIRSFEDIAGLKTQTGKDIYLLGGGQLVRTLIDMGFVDELRLITYPVIAGGAYSLFGHNEMRHQAELVMVRDLGNGLVRSDYRFMSQ